MIFLISFISVLCPGFPKLWHIFQFSTAVGAVCLLTTVTRHCHETFTSQIVTCLLQLPWPILAHALNTYHGATVSLLQGVVHKSTPKTKMDRHLWCMLRCVATKRWSPCALFFIWLFYSKTMPTFSLQTFYAALRLALKIPLCHAVRLADNHSAQLRVFQHLNIAVHVCRWRGCWKRMLVQI
mgnify:CR=1 FL=1